MVMNPIRALMIVILTSCTNTVQQSQGSTPYDASLRAVLTINSPEGRILEAEIVIPVAAVAGSASTDWCVGWVAPSSSEQSGCVARYSGDDGAIRWLVTPDVPAPSYGYSMCVLDDIDRDGVRELAIGAPDVGVYFGKECTTFVDVRSGKTGALIARLPGRAPSDRFGASLLALADVDGDAITDFLIGAPTLRQTPTKGGSIELRSGRTFDLLYEVQLEQPNNIGFGVDSCGDVDGDGIRDFCDSSGAADLFVWSGRDGRPVLHIIPKAEFVSQYKPSGFIDLDGDGRLDYFGVQERSTWFLGPITSSASLDITTGRWTARGSETFLAVVDLKGCAKECEAIMAVIPWWGSVELRDKCSPTKVLTAFDLRTVKSGVFWRHLSQCAPTDAGMAQFAVWGVEPLHAERLSPSERGVVAILEVRLQGR